MRRPPVSSLLLIGGGIAYYVDAFLPWAEEGERAWNVPLAGSAGFTALALVLVELTRVSGVWRTPTSSLLAFFLAAVTGILAVSSLFVLRWGWFFDATFAEFRYGAWLGIALGAALCLGAAARLREHMR